MDVAAWKRSGKTAREYAEERGISAASLAWWSSQGSRRAGQGDNASRRVVAPGGGPRTGADTRGAVQVSAPAFLPVSIGDLPAATDTPRLRAEVVLAGGRCVRVVGELTLEQFARLLDAVEGGESC